MNAQTKTVTEATTADQRRAARQWLDDAITIQAGSVLQSERMTGSAPKYEIEHLKALRTLRVMIAGVPE